MVRIESSPVLGGQTTSGRSTTEIASARKCLRGLPSIRGCAPRTSEVAQSVPNPSGSRRPWGSLRPWPHCKRLHRLCCVGLPDQVELLQLAEDLVPTRSGLGRFPPPRQNAGISPTCFEFLARGREIRSCRAVRRAAAIRPSTISRKLLRSRIALPHRRRPGGYSRRHRQPGSQRVCVEACYGSPAVRRCFSNSAFFPLLSLHGGS